MSKPERRDLAKEQFWRQLFAQWQQSGLTGRDFCATHRLSEASFYAWRREIARRDRQAGTERRSATNRPVPQLLAPQARAVPAFLEVQWDAAVVAPLEVVLVHGRRLLVRPGFDADLLRQVLRVLEEPAC
jgi:hypothetical protein